MARSAALTLLLVAGCRAGVVGGGDDDQGSDARDQPGVDARSGDGAPDGPVGPRACKRGVAYNREDGADADALRRGVGWWYDWAPVPDGAAHAALDGAGLEYVPMIWTGPPRAGIDVDGLIADIPDGAEYLLGFNEPNFGVQANLTPQQAADAWPQLEQIADARGLKLVSPAVNYCGGDCNQTDPFVWLDAFFAACDGCRVDYVALHWYACSRDALRNILDRYAEYGKPLWLTEIACLDAADTSEAVQQRYMAEAVPVLEADPHVFRYAWFIGRSFPDVFSYALLDNQGGLTALGDSYVGFDGACAP